MRPGLIRPGNQPGASEFDWPPRGFNEARADSPGKCAYEDIPFRRKQPRRRRFNEARADSPGKCGPTRPSRRRTASQRFNEARADSPGKCDELVRVIRERWRFNEARADSPGKCDEGMLTTWASSTLDASMRPGLIRPGNVALIDEQKSHRSSGFNEARADSPGKCSIQAGGTRRSPMAASMRPGLIRPGNMATRRSWPGSGDTSTLQ